MKTLFLISCIIISKSAFAEFASKKDLFQSLSEHGFAHVIEVSKFDFYKTDGKAGELFKDKLILTQSGEKTQLFEKRLPEFDYRFPVGFVRSKVENGNLAMAFNVADVMVCYKVRRVASNIIHRDEACYIIPYSIDYVAKTISQGKSAVGP